MLQITLQPNPLTEKPNDFMAMVTNVVYKTEGDIIRQITGPGSILKTTECVAVIHAYWDSISENLKEGVGFTSEYVHVTPAAGGVFDDEEESFNDKKHWKGVNLSAGKVLTKSASEMKVGIKRSTVPVPYVRNFLDIFSNTSNQVITNGFVADITGDLLKIEGNDAGIFFINTTTAAVYEVNRLHVNEPKKLTLLIPELPAGSYRVEVRTHIRGGKELRTGFLNAILTVV
jgi:hypothetical protein